MDRVYPSAMDSMGNECPLPRLRHAGQDAALLEKRVHVYEAAKAKYPQRWSGSTRNWQPVHVVHLNPDQQKLNTPRRKENQTALKKVA